MIFIKTLFSILFITLLSACASIDTKTQAPKISFNSAQLINMGLFEQTYNIQVNMHNPNHSSMPITRMTYQIYINDMKFASETHNKNFVLQAGETKKVDLLTGGNLLKLAPKLGLKIQDINKNNQRKLSYKITGNINTNTKNSSIPYSEKGEISIAELMSHL